MSFALGLLVGAAMIAMASWFVILSCLERVDAQVRSARKHAAEAANAAGHAHEQASTLRHRFDQRFRDLADGPPPDPEWSPRSGTDDVGCEPLMDPSGGRIDGRADAREHEANDPQEVDAA